MRLTLSSVILLLGAVAVASSGYASDPDRYVVPLQETVAGSALDEYASFWWQWAYSMSPEVSAVVDETGAQCHVNQTGDVWFLAGGYGTSLIQRSCAVPAGKYLFFPVINMVYAQPGNRQISCAAAMYRAALNNDALLVLDVELDGTRLTEPERFRLKSPECFDLAGRIPPELNPAPVYPSAADGYWIMLKPLPRGSHTLKFRAIYNREGGAFGSMAQDIEYSLTIE